MDEAPNLCEKLVLLKLEKWPQKLYLIAKFHVNCMILKELCKVKKSLHGNSEER